jgi:hypothetical protein
MVSSLSTLLRDRRLQRVASVVVLALLFLYAGSARLDARLERAREPLSSQLAAATVPDHTSLVLLSLGHREALADLLWLNALSYFGQHRGLSRDARWLRPHLDAITHLDPRFELVYAWAATVTMYGGRIDAESIGASNEILELGIEAFPSSWELHFMLGVNYAFEMSSDDPEERARQREYGSRMIARASVLPSAPAFLQATAATLLRRAGSTSMGIQSSFDALTLSDDASVRWSSENQFVQLLPPPHLASLTEQSNAIRAIRAEPSLTVAPAQLALLLHPDLARWRALPAPLVEDDP